MSTRPGLSIVLMAWLLAGCAGEVPYTTSFDASGGTVDVEVLGDGFVRTTRRLPLELLVLELRQQMRAMDDGRRSRVVVRLKVKPGIVDGPSAEVARSGCNRLIDELRVMDVGQVVLL